MQDILVELNGAMSGLSQETEKQLHGGNRRHELLYPVRLFVGRRRRRRRRGRVHLDTANRSLREFRRRPGRNGRYHDGHVYRGAMAIFGSAVDDAKIRLCEVFAPLAKDAIKGVADVIPSITDRAVGVAQSFYNTVVPAAENFAKKAIAAFNQAKPAFDEIRHESHGRIYFFYVIRESRPSRISRRKLKKTSQRSTK